MGFWSRPVGLSGWGKSLVPAAFFCLAASGSVSAADGPAVVRVRHFTAPDHTRVVLDLTRAGEYEVRRVVDPDRIAINLPGGAFQDQSPLAVGDGLLRGIRCNPGSRRAQVVLDLEERAEFRSFALPAAAGRPERIVVDILRPRADGDARQDADADRAPPLRPFTVIIDPGHGGMDPGAIRGRLREKDIVLDIGREMARLIEALPGYQARLTRDGDYGRELWERVAFARREAGDLFLSVHCNTHPRDSVSGMEVYFLSLQGATDREASELADLENAAHLVGLSSSDGSDDLVMDILMDLKMSQVLHESARLADCLLEAGDRSGGIAGRKVKQAGFHVLKSLAMPSALVEAAYLSHAGDRRLLADAAARRRLAAALVEGVLRWRRDQAAVAELGLDPAPAWTRRYEVRRGDSLWTLARRHGTTVTEISLHNRLADRAIMVGQVLRLPEVGQRP